jgi:hypothetical protein
MPYKYRLEKKFKFQYYKNMEQVKDQDVKTSVTKPNYRIDKEQVIAMYNGGMPVRVIAEKQECAKSNIYQMIARHKNEAQDVKSFQDLEADILSGKKAKLLSKLDDETINSIPIDSMNDVKNLTVALGVLTDKERLIAGASTHNFSILTIDKSMDEMRKMEAEMSRLQSSLSETPDK